MAYKRLLRLSGIGVGTALMVCGWAPAGASSANLSHSYHAESRIANGSILTLDPQRSDYVQLANATNGARLIGVAVDKNDSLLAVDAGNNLLQVATSGSTTTLVSTINGPVQVGDQIAVSPFNGIGMKSAAGSHVVGLAQTAFNEHSSGAKRQDVVDKSGRHSTISIGYIRLSIAVGTDTTSGNGPQLNSLQRLAKSLTGHVISTPRVVLSLIVATTAMAALITLIYAAIYGSIISIGRNPLAKYAVFRTLGAVLGMAALTAAVAVVTVFFLLH